MITGFTILLVCQLVGEILARGFGLPVPGPVLGLIVLVVGLALAHRPSRTASGHLETLEVTRVSDALLANLSLLFVPAGVGIVDQLGVLRSQAVAIGASLVISTAVTLLVTVLVFRGVKRLMARGAEEVA